MDSDVNEKLAVETGSQVESSPPALMEIRLGASQPWQDRMVKWFLVGNVFLTLGVIAIGVIAWQAGAPKALAMFPIGLGSLYLLILPFEIRRRANPTEIILRKGTLWTRRGSRERTIIALAEIQELILWRSAIPGVFSAPSGDGFDALILMRKPWDAWPPRWQRSLRQTPNLMWRGVKCFQASSFDRSLTDVARFLAGEVHKTTSRLPQIYSLAYEEGPTLLTGWSEIHDWYASPAAADTGIPSGTVCRSCHYDLRGLASDGRCPECGTLVETTLKGNRLRNADSDWLKRVARGARLAARGGLACTLIIAAIYSLLLFAPKPVPPGYLPLVVACILLGTAFIPVAVGAWMMTRPETPETDKSFETMRRPARRLWWFPLVFIFVAWTVGVPLRFLVISVVASVLAPLGALVSYTGALLGRADVRKWPMFAAGEGALAIFLGFIAPMVMTQSHLVGYVKRLIPGSANAPAGGVAPPIPPPVAPTVNPLADSAMLKAFLLLGIILFISSTGALFWAPIVKLAAEIRKWVEEEKET